MAVSKMAVFIGGPCDGQGMLIGTEPMPYILIPRINGAAAVFNLPDASSPELSRMSVHHYDHTLIGGLPSDTRLEFYAYNRRQSDE